MMIRFLILLFLAAPALAGTARHRPQPKVERVKDRISCDDVRQFVAQNGAKHALELALQNGISTKQLREAAKCLK